jgi:hypothetical protein
MQLYASMTPTGHQDPGPTSGPRGAATVHFDATNGVIRTHVAFAGTGTPTPAGPPCGDIYP